MHRNVRTALLALALAGPASAQAQTLTFEGLLADGGCCITVPTGYGGFDWGDFNLITKSVAPFLGYGYGTNGVVSSFFNWYLTPSYVTKGGSAFSWTGATFTGAWAPEDVTINGYLMGVLQGTVSASLSNTSQTVVSANFSNVDQLEFIGATPTTGANGNHQIVMDDFQYGPAVVATPEPGALLLLGTGLAGVSGATRRRRRAVAGRTRV